MYLVLKPDVDPYTGKYKEGYRAAYVGDNSITVHEMLKEEKTVVYKLDGLTRIKEIKVDTKDIVDRRRS